MREQRLVFGEVAGTYDRVRPDYPDEILDDLVAVAAVPAGGHVLEIGAGTGKATVPLAGRGLRVTALEPDAAMAGVLASRLPGVDVVVSNVEDYDPGGRRFDLVVAAQSWHWVDPERRCRIVRDLLAPGGTLALMFNRPVWDGEHSQPEMRADLHAAYAEHVPELDAREPGYGGLTAQLEGDAMKQELDGCGLFDGDTDVRVHWWHRTLVTADYLDLLRTQSDHRMLPEDRLERLLHAVRTVLEAHGGTICLDYFSKLYLTKAGREAAS